MNRPSKAVIAIALTLGILCFAVSAKGYGMVIRYGWFVWLVFILFVFGLRSSRRDGLSYFFLNIAIVIAVGAGGLFIGDWTRRAICFRKTRSCDPVLVKLETYHSAHGTYPTNIPPNELSQGISIQQRPLTGGDLNLNGITESDATLYLGTNGFLCVVPVTKMLPISFTRFYVYMKSETDHDWRYDYCVWMIGLIK